MKDLSVVSVLQLPLKFVWSIQLLNWSIPTYSGLASSNITWSPSAIFLSLIVLSGCSIFRQKTASTRCMISST